MVRFSSSLRNLALASGKLGIQKKEKTPQRMAGMPSMMKTQLCGDVISGAHVNCGRRVAYRQPSNPPAPLMKEIANASSPLIVPENWPHA